MTIIDRKMPIFGIYEKMLIFWIDKKSQFLELWQMSISKINKKMSIFGFNKKRQFLEFIDNKCQFLKLTKNGNPRIYR